MFNFKRDNTSRIAKWLRSIDKQILSTIILLFFLGILFSFSSTSTVAADKLDKETYFFFLKHLAFVTIALFVMLVISFIENEKIEKYLFPIFLFSLFLLFLVPIIGVEVKGSKRWLDLPFLPNIQPIEFLKPLFVLLTAKILISYENFTKYLRYIISFFILSVVVVLLINQPDFGQTLLIILSWIIMIFASGINLFFLIIVGTLFLASLVTITLLFPNKFGYILYRIQTFLDPEKGDNFQSQKALEAIKQGGLTGQGMGEGILKDRVPEAHTDYIIAVVSEEFGIVFVLFIVILFLFILYKVINKVFLTENEFIKLALVGLISLFIIQTFIHLGVNTRLLPTTGMTLPFLSYGGSSLIGSAIVAGVILNFTKNTPRKI